MKTLDETGKDKDEDLQSAHEVRPAENTRNWFRFRFRGTVSDCICLVYIIMSGIVAWALFGDMITMKFDQKIKTMIYAMYPPDKPSSPFYIYSHPPPRYPWRDANSVHHDADKQ